MTSLLPANDGRIHRRTPSGGVAPQWSLVGFALRRVRYYGCHPLAWTIGATALVLLVIVGLIGREPVLSTREARLAAVSAVYETIARDALVATRKRMGGAAAAQRRFGVDLRMPDLPTYRQAMHEALVMLSMGDGDEQIRTVRQLLNTQLEIGGELVTGHHLNSEVHHEVFTSLSDAHTPHWKMQHWETMNADWKMRRMEDPDDLSGWIQKHFVRQTADGVNVAAPVADTFMQTFASSEWRSGYMTVGSCTADMTRTAPDEVFKYLLLFWQGGLWADPDAVPLRPIRDFPGIWDGRSSRNIAHPTLLKLAQSSHLAEQTGLVQRLLHGDVSVSAVAKAIRADLRSLTGMPRSPPRLIVAFDQDSTSSPPDWRVAGLSRGMQICTWTMMAVGPAAASQPALLTTTSQRKYHPVLLDAMSRAFNKVGEWQKHPSLAPTGKNATLELGPGVMTDAVWNYIYVRWGLTPDQVGLRGSREMVRVGDVLFYPDGTFHGWGWNATAPYATLTNDLKSNATWPGLAWPFALVHQAKTGQWRDEYLKPRPERNGTRAAVLRNATRVQD